MRDVPTEFQVINSVYATTNGQDDTLLLEVASYNIPAQIVSFNLRDNTYEVLMKSSSVDVPKDYISKPEPLIFKTTGGRGMWRWSSNGTMIIHHRTLLTQC